MATNPSCSPSVKLITPTEIGAQLQHLRQLLNTLPPSLPTTCVSYNFVDFSPDTAEVDDYGIEGALNHALEVALCPGGRQQGPIIFKEHRRLNFTYFTRPLIRYAYCTCPRGPNDRSHCTYRPQT